jgi:Enolase C-terminal domain-like
MHAIDLANALAEFEPYWFEEPCQSENVEALAEVRHASRIPVVTGEALLTRAGFRPVIRTRAVDIINPDVSNCGGILELMYIAAAAESEAIAVSPHNYNSTTMALSATVHASACMPNFIITEYFLQFEAQTSYGRVDGYIALPDDPGLGLNVDEKAVRAAQGKRFPARTFRSLADEGPRHWLYAIPLARGTDPPPLKWFLDREPLRRDGSGPCPLPQARAHDGRRRDGGERAGQGLGLRRAPAGGTDDRPRRREVDDWVSLFQGDVGRLPTEAGPQCGTRSY